MANKGCNLRKQDFTNAELICGFSNLQKLEYIFTADCYILCATLFFKYRLKTVQYKNTILYVYICLGEKNQTNPNLFFIYLALRNLSKWVCTTSTQPLKELNI